MESTIPAPRGSYPEFCAAIGVDSEEVATASVVRALHARLERSDALLDAAIRERANSAALEPSSADAERLSAAIRDLRGEIAPEDRVPEPYGCDTGRLPISALGQPR